MKIHCIIQARTNSSRLPGKIYKKIGDNSLLKMVVDRCVLAQNISRVVVAKHGGQITQDRTWGASWLDGSEEPAARFMETLSEYPCDGFVRVCADSPFIDWPIIDCAAGYKLM